MDSRSRGTNRWLDGWYIDRLCQQWRLSQSGTVKSSLLVSLLTHLPGEVSDGGPQHLRARCPLLSEVQVKQLFSPQSAASDRLFGLFFSEMILVLPWTPTVPAYLGGTHPTFRNPLIVCALWVVTDKWGCYISTVVHSQNGRKSSLSNALSQGTAQSEDPPFYVVWSTLGQHDLNNVLEQWGEPLKPLRTS